MLSVLMEISPSNGLLRNIPIELFAIDNGNVVNVPYEHTILSDKLGKLAILDVFLSI